jgi:hypothetical protein
MPLNEIIISLSLMKKKRIHQKISFPNFKGEKGTVHPVKLLSKSQFNYYYDDLISKNNLKIEEI